MPEAWDGIADLIAATAEFQTWTGLGSEVLARPRVITISSAAEDVQYPNARVFEPQAETISLGGWSAGRYDFGFEQQYAKETSEEDILEDLMSHVRPIVREMLTRSRNDTVDRVYIRNVTLASPPGCTREEDDEEKVTANVVYSCETGISGLP